MAGESSTGQRNQVAVDSESVPELGFGPFVTGILQPEFRGDKEFVTGDTALFQCVPDLDFILIRGGGVNQSITAVNSVNDRSFAFGGIGHLKYTKAQQGHFNTVVQFYFCMVLSFRYRS